MTTALTTNEQAQLDDCEAVIERGLNSFVEVGQALIKVRDQRLYRSDYDIFEDYCRNRWGFSGERARLLMRGAEVVERLTETPTMVGVLPTSERQARPLATLPSQDQSAAWQRAVETAPDGKVTAAHVQRVVDEVRRPALPAPTFTQIGTASGGSTLLVKEQERATKATFNRTNENVDWAWWTWNPVTGCLHGCPYCYAREIAHRFYPQGFEPTFHPDRIEAPRNQAVPKSDDPRSRRVFTCSMADLFGKWVPADWVDAVLTEVRNNQQWEFLFLTKFPQRLAETDWPDNAWVGTSVDRQHRVAVAERAFANVKAGVRWLSIEPLLEPVRFESLAMFDWVVIGAQSATNQPDGTRQPAFMPPASWVVSIMEQATSAGCKIFIKDNLLPVIRQEPRTRAE